MTDKEAAENERLQCSCMVRLWELAELPQPWSDEEYAEAKWLKQLFNELYDEYEEWEKSKCGES